MPTAAELRADATILADSLEPLRVVRVDVARDWDDLGYRGGASFLVRDWLDDAVADVDELARLVTAVADELQRRAALCDQYTADVRRHADARRRWSDAVDRYRAAADTDRPVRWPGPEPEPPALPFPGAEAG